MQWEWRKSGKQHTQVSALVPFWNTGEASALNTFPISGGVVIIVGAARALAFIYCILDHELIEVVPPVTLHGDNIGGL